MPEAGALRNWLQAAPGCGSDAVTAKQPCAGARRDADPEFLQLTFDPYLAPARVLLGHAQDQASRDERETCASGFSAGGGLRRPGARGPGASTRGALLGGEGSPPGGKHEILKLDLLVDAIPGGEDAEQSTKHHIEECGEHGRDSATHGRSGASGARETGPEGHDRVFAPDGLRMSLRPRCESVRRAPLTRRP